MVNYKTDYKVGDKVRILDVSKINGGCEYWKTGDMTEVVDLLWKGQPKLKSTVKGASIIGNFLDVDELEFIELVYDSEYELTDFLLGLEDKIKSLEKRVEELENKSNKDKVSNTNIRFAIEDKLDSKDLASKIIETLSKYKQKEKLSNNEMRKQIIQETKELIEIYVTDSTMINVNNETKIVTAVIIKKNGEVITGKAKFNEDESLVYNEYIGGAIALSKVWDLDYSKFENAIEPDKIVEGMIIKSNGNYPYALHGAYYPGDLFEVVNEDDELSGYKCYKCYEGSVVSQYSDIVEDTHAKY